MIILLLCVIIYLISLILKSIYEQQLTKAKAFNLMKNKTTAQTAFNNTNKPTAFNVINRLKEINRING